MLFILCGLTAGILGGYLGLGGGIIMVPYLTIVMGLDMKEAVPISMISMVASTLSASRSYVKKTMVETELVVVIANFMVIGSITGSSLSSMVPSAYLQLLFSGMIVYAGIIMIRKKDGVENQTEINNKNSHFVLAAFLALLTGLIASLVGVGGGVFIIPILYLLLGKPIGMARGTSTMSITFSATAASIVYFFQGALEPSLAVPVIFGVTIGGTIGGRLGTVARPKVVKIIFFIILLYIAYKLSYRGIQGL